MSSSACSALRQRSPPCLPDPRRSFGSARSSRSLVVGGERIAFSHQASDIVAAASAISADSRSISRTQLRAARRSSSADRSRARRSSASSCSRASRRRCRPAAAAASASRSAGSAAAAIALMLRRIGLRARAIGDQAGVRLKRALGVRRAAARASRWVRQRDQRLMARGCRRRRSYSARPAAPGASSDFDLRVDLARSRRRAASRLSSAARSRSSASWRRACRPADAGRLFEDAAARLRLGGDQLADLALAAPAPANAAPVAASANSSCTSRARTSRPLMR